MKTGRFSSIRFKIALLVMGCVVPASLIAVILITYNYQQERARLIADSIDTARAITATVDRDLGGTEAALVALATSPSLADDDLPAFYRQAQRALREQAASNVLLIDRSGQQILNTRRPFGAPLPLYGNLPHLQGVFDTGKSITSDLFIGALVNRPLVTIGVPVRRGDKVAYMLSASIVPERLLKILVRQNLSGGRIGVIYDGAGTIVARTRGMDSFVGKKVSPGLLEASGKNPQGSIETNTVEGVPVIFTYSRSVESNWTVGIGIPTEVLTDQLWQLIKWLIAATVVLLAGSLGLAWAIGGHIANALHHLIEPALKLGSGRPVTVPPIPLKEADEIGRALTKASDMLQRAEYLAHHDILTGLANRALFNDFLDRQRALCDRHGTHLSVLFIDLDGFKAINDAHGHAAGDELLVMVAARLAAGVRISDMVARLGGDEFAVVLVDAEVKNAATIAAKLIRILSTPFEADTQTFVVSASIGIAGYPDSASTSVELVQRADAAMYRAKSLGKQRYVVADAVNVVPGLTDTN